MYKYRELTPEQQAEVVEERLARGYPAHSPPHPINDQPFYLLTAACYEHKHHVRSQERRRQILSKLSELFTENGVEMLAWVVLPNHYHLLVHVTKFRTLGRIFRLVHGAASRQWNLEDETPGRKVWYRYADRAIRSERHYYTTLNYIRSTA
jgi:putative transposase